jgi:hypothetical protein
MAGIVDEFRVLGVRDRKRANREVVYVRTVKRTLVVFAVFGAHDEFASGDSRHLQPQFVSHLLWVECT